MARETEESYYKILGTTARISQRRIKEKYIAAVKEHPPETDPERFEKIREAYETLRDPLKRKQYDLARKYGGKLEKMLDEAYFLIMAERYAQAEQIFNNILAIDADNILGQIGVMSTSVIKGDLGKGEKCFRQVLDNPRNKQEEEIEPEFIYTTYAALLHNEEQYEQAYDILEEGMQRFPSSRALFCSPLVTTCLALEKVDRAWEVIQLALPNEDEETIEDLEVFTTWLFLISSLEKWSELPKAQARLRKYLRKLVDEEEREEAALVFLEEYEEAFDRCSYRLAEVFIELAKPLVDNLDEIKEDLKEVKKLARAEKDLMRLMRDDSIYPLVLYHAMHWFFEDDDHPVLRQLEQAMPFDVLEGLDDQEEWFAAGILQLQKKYPALYRQFKAEWDELFAELTKDFNREMRRELRKLK